MLVHSSAECDLLTLLGTDGLSEGDLGQVALDGLDLAAGGGRADVDHEDLRSAQLLHLGLLAAVAGLDTEQPAEEVVGDLNLGKYIGELSSQTEDLSDQPIGTGEGGVDASSDTDETTRNGILQRVGFGEQTGHTGVDGRASHGTVTVGGLGHDTGSDLDLVVDSEDTLKDGPTGNAALQVGHVLTGLVDVEGTDDDHAGYGGEVPKRNGNAVDEVFTNDVDVVLEDGTDGDDGRRVGDGTGHELSDLLVLGQGCIGLDEIDLVLENDDVLQTHNFHGSQVLRCLGLGTGFIARNKKKGGVHDGRTVEHGGHENVVAGTIHERHMSAQMISNAGLFVCKGIGMGRSTRGVEPTLLLVVIVAAGFLAALIFGSRIALVYFGIGIPQLDGDIPLELVLEPDRLHTRDGLDDRRLAVCYVADGTDVDGRLATDLQWVKDYKGVNEHRLANMNAVQ